MERITISVADTAQTLGICRGTVYNLIARGKLRSAKVGTRTVVSTASIRELLGEAA
jgi:excisionase family DNA binding protein